MFDHCAIFVFKGDDGDAILEILMDADVDVTDVECEEGNVTVFAPHTEYSNVKQALLAGMPEIDFEIDEIQFLAQNTAPINEEEMVLFDKFLDLLNDLDDVQNVYHSVEL